MARQHLLRFFVITVGVLIATAAMAQAQDIDVPDEYAASTIAVGMVDGRDIVATNDGRLFVALGDGDIRVIENDTLLPTPMITIPVDTRAQEGLHSLALDENFDQNGYLYAVFTAQGVDVNRLSRFTVNGNQATLASEQVIYDLPPMNGANSHYGAAVVDNGDGTLLLTIGDHEREPNGQDRSTRESSVLRVNKDGTIPGDNPYVGNANFDDAIFAYGFRNPWQMARSSNGTIAVSDVGSSNWEELNIITPGSNYGWADAEGAGGIGEDPLFTYPHFGQVAGAQFEGCAITGSTFYEPDVVQLPSRFVGDLFVGDLCAGWIAAVDPSTGNVEEFATGFDSLADMTTNPANGALYVLDRKLADGRTGVSKIEFVGDDVALRITSQPETQRLAIGQRASFFVAAIGQGDLTYQWQRNGVNIPGATSPLYEIPSVTAADNEAQFRAVVSDDLDRINSSLVEIIVSSNNAPTPVIATPVVGSTYAGGDEIVIRGSATDIEDGSVPNASLSWEVRLNHDAHDHGYTGEVTGTNEFTIQIPRTGETDDNVWYTVYLQATDSDGASTTVTRRIDPETSQFTIRTLPAGGVLNLDGPPVDSPFTTDGVVGVERTLAASLAQEINGVSHGFVSWSNGGDPEHTIQTAAANRTYTANYSPLPLGPANGDPSCRTVRIDGIPVISLSGDRAGASINLLRGGGWIQNVSDFDLYVDRDNAGPNVNYTIRVRDDGVVTDYPCANEQWPPDDDNPDPPDPPEDVTCTATVNGNNTVTLTFTGNGDDSANLRRDGKWIGNVTGQSTYTDNQVGTSYVLITRPDGTTVNTTCTVDDDNPDPPDPPDPPGDISCTAVINDDDTVDLTFVGNGDIGANLRRDGKWIGRVTGFSTFTDDQVGDTYVLITRDDGVRTDTTCTFDDDNPDPPDPPPDGVTCTATVNGNNTVTLTFTGNDDNSANLRRDGKWIRNVTGQSTYTDNQVGTTYILIVRGAETTTTTCTID